LSVNFWCFKTQRSRSN